MNFRTISFTLVILALGHGPVQAATAADLKMILPEQFEIREDAESVGRLVVVNVLKRDLSWRSVEALEEAGMPSDEVGWEMGAEIENGALLQHITQGLGASQVVLLTQVLGAEEGARSSDFGSFFADTDSFREAMRKRVSEAKADWLWLVSGDVSSQMGARAGTRTLRSRDGSTLHPRLSIFNGSGTALLVDTRTGSIEGTFEAHDEASTRKEGIEVRETSETVLNETFRKLAEKILDHVASPPMTEVSSAR